MCVSEHFLTCDVEFDAKALVKLSCDVSGRRLTFVGGIPTTKTPVFLVAVHSAPGDVPDVPPRLESEQQRR